MSLRGSTYTTQRCPLASSSIPTNDGGVLGLPAGFSVFLNAFFFFFGGEWFLRSISALTGDDLFFNIIFMHYRGSFLLPNQSQQSCLWDNTDRSDCFIDKGVPVRL